MSSGGLRQPVIAHVRVRPGTSEVLYRRLHEQLHDFSPMVQLLLPSAMVVDLSAAPRYFGRSPAALAAQIRLRALAHHGVDTRIGLSPAWAVSAMASSRPEDNGIRTVHPDAVPRFLGPLPIGALYGITNVQARTLVNYGVQHIGLFAELPEATAQRLLGGRAGRLLHERSRGIDRRAVVPTGLAATTSARRNFPTDTLDPDVVRAALLGVCVELGERLRRHHRAVARSLTLVIVFSDRTQLVRSRTLPEASAHTEDLRDAAYALFGQLGLQRARLRAVALKVEMIPAGRAMEQISLDPAREARRRIEPVLDRINARWPGTAAPAAAYRPAS